MKPVAGSSVWQVEHWTALQPVQVSASSTSLPGLFFSVRAVVTSLSQPIASNFVLSRQAVSFWRTLSELVPIHVLRTGGDERREREDGGENPDRGPRSSKPHEAARTHGTIHRTLRVFSTRDPRRCGLPSPNPQRELKQVQCRR